MEIVKKDEALKGSNSNVCKKIEYSFNDKDMDLCIATITGRYPDVGYCMNLKSKELIYVMEGKGILELENKKIEFSQGDSIIISPNEKYYWDSEYTVISMICTPAWSIEQYKAIKE